MFLIKIGDSIKTFIISILRIALVGGGTLGVILSLIDKYLKPELGITNIYVTIFTCAFFPMLFVLTVEIYCWFTRRQKKKKKNNMIYLKDTVINKPLTK